MLYLSRALQWLAVDHIIWLKFSMKMTLKMDIIPKPLSLIKVLTFSGRQGSWVSLEELTECISKGIKEFDGKNYHKGNFARDMKKEVETIDGINTIKHMFQ